MVKSSSLINYISFILANLLVIFISTVAHANICTDNSQATLDKVHAVQRALSCRNTADINECNEFLGLGIAGAGFAATLGTKAALKVRNPDLRICPIKSTSVLKFSFISQAEAAACMPRQTLKQMRLKYATDRGITDLKALDQKIAEQLKVSVNADAQIQVQEKAVADSRKLKQLVDYDDERGAKLKVLQNIENSLPEGAEVSSLTLERAQIKYEITRFQSGQKGALSPSEYNQIQARKIAIDKRLKELGPILRNNPQVQAALSDFQTSNNRYINYRDQNIDPKEIRGNPIAEEQKLKSLRAQQDKVTQLKSAQSVVRENLKTLEQAKLNLARGATSLDKVADTLYGVGATSKQQLSQLHSYQFIEELGAGKSLSKLRKIMPFASKLGWVGTLVGFASAASAGEINPWVSDTIATLTFTNVQEGCPGSPEYPFLDREGCKLITQLTAKSERFFDQSDEDILKNMMDPSYCDLIQNVHQDFYYPKDLGTVCGKKIEVNLRQSSFMTFPSDLADSTTSHQVQLLDDSKTYNITIKPDGSFGEVLYTYKTPSDSYALAKIGIDTSKVVTRKLDPSKDQETLQKARNVFQMKLAPMLETAACCQSGDDGMKPTSNECAMLGVTAGSNSNKLDTDAPSGVR